MHRGNGCCSPSAALRLLADAGVSGGPAPGAPGPLGPAPGALVWGGRRRTGAPVAGARRQGRAPPSFYAAAADQEARWRGR